MLADLKVLEDKLYQGQTLDDFCQKYSVHDVIRQLNKATKKETRDRIQYFFSKLSQSNHYKSFISACLDTGKDNWKEFTKYVSSEYSEEFFTLLQNKRHDVLFIVENNQAMVPILLKLISYEFGIKLIKLFKELYQQDSGKYECLFNPEIKRGLQEGLGLLEGEPDEEVDSVAQMRYFEILVNIAVIGGKCFAFVGDLLNRALNLYKTEDILLKMAIVQIISNLGDGVQTSQLLREHRIWKLVQKDVADPDQQFYVKKYLLVLLIDMSNHGFYQLTPKVVKDIHEFLKINIISKGEYLETAIDLIGHLFKSAEGTKVIVQNSEIFNAYVNLRRQTQDNIKQPFYQTLVSLTTIGENSQQAKESPKYRLVLNIINCIGHPSLATGLTQTVHSNNYMVQGLSGFCEWFSELLKMPFEQAEYKLIQVFINLLNFYEIAETLFQMQETTRYLLKQVAPNDHNKELRLRKNQLINIIIAKGEQDWKDKELSEFSRNLEKLIKNKNPSESIYALDVQ